jgi:tetratricopeptide (TPR) repeat protein
MKGTMYLQLERASQAAAQFDSARTLLEVMRVNQPDQAWIHGLLGEAYAGLKRPEEAIRSAERAEQLLPVSKDALDGPEWVINLGRVHVMLGNEARAIAYYARALSIPSWVSANSLRRDPLLAKLNRNPEFQKVLAAHP